jgi:hypothetical protein
MYILVSRMGTAKYIVEAFMSIQLCWRLRPEAEKRHTCQPSNLNCLSKSHLKVEYQKGEYLWRWTTTTALQFAQRSKIRHHANNEGIHILTNLLQKSSLLGLIVCSRQVKHCSNSSQALGRHPSQRCIIQNLGWQKLKPANCENWNISTLLMLLTSFICHSFSPPKYRYFSQPFLQ